MATRVVYTSEGGGVQSTSATYATARTSGTLASGTNIGQTFSTPNYTCAEAFHGYNTKGITTASSVTLYLNVGGDNSATDFTINCRMDDFGGGAATTADWVSGADLGAMTLVSTLSTAGLALGYVAMTDVALVSNINTAGSTRFVLSSSRHEGANTPTGLENVAVYGYAATLPNRPSYLSVVDNSTQSSQTISAGTTTFTPTRTGLHDLDLWGGGGRNAASASQEGGAGGGAYSYAVYDVTSLSNISCSVGATQTTNNSAGNDSWFVSSADPDPLAKGGGASTSGGAASSGRGLVRLNGGGGAAAQGGGGTRGGSGGGGSAGTTGAGVNGTAGSGSAGGAGGASGTTQSAAGGTAPGGSGTTATLGGGGGAGGGTGAVGGGSGGVPGGGAGGGSSASGNAGNGAAGKIIVYWYTTPTAAPAVSIVAPMLHLLVR